MATSKMTEREIYNAMLTGSLDAETMAEFAQHKLEQLDKRNASAAKRAAAKRAEGDALMAEVATFVTDEPKTREQITLEMIEAGHDVTVGKVQARLNKLIANGEIAKAKAKAQAQDGKTRVVTVYALEFDAE